MRLTPISTRTLPLPQASGRNSWWYRLVDSKHDSVIEDLTIGSVERLLAQMGYHLADLVDVPAPRDPGTDRAPRSA